MAVTISNLFRRQLAHGDIAFPYPGSLQLKVALFGSNLVYNPNMNMQQDGTGFFFAAGETIYRELEGIGYIQGGMEVSNVTLTNDVENPIVTLDGDDLIFPAVTLTNVKYGALYLTQPFWTYYFIGVWDLGTPQSPAGVDYKIQWSVNGILRIT